MVVGGWFGVELLACSGGGSNELGVGQVRKKSGFRDGSICLTKIVMGWWFDGRSSDELTGRKKLI